jgi:hypothetical protein
MDFDEMDHIPRWEEIVAIGANFSGKEKLSPSEIKLLRDKNNRAKALYNQGRELYKYVSIFCDTLNGNMAGVTSDLIMQNVLIICPKIIAAEAIDKYVFRMECAATIRSNCKELIVQVDASDILSLCVVEYKDIVLIEMKKFRALFKKWVTHFDKDKTKDEWSLFS